MVKRKLANKNMEGRAAFESLSNMDIQGFPFGCFLQDSLLAGMIMAFAQQKQISNEKAVELLWAASPRLEKECGIGLARIKGATLIIMAVDTKVSDA